MYEPKYSYTDKAVSNLIKIEQNRTFLSSLDISYEIKSKIGQNQKTIEMFHTAHILGIETTLKEIERLIQTRQSSFANDNKSYILNNYRHAIEFSRSNVADTYPEISTTVMLHLNKLILTQWRETWEVRFRNLEGEFDNSFDDWTELRDEGLEPHQVINLVNDLIEWYKSAMPTITPIVRIAIFIYRLMEIFPFVAGNKITIIAITDYMLLKNGFSAKAFSSTSRIFDSNNNELIQAFNLSSRNFNLNFWVETFSSKLLKELLQAREEANKFMAAEESSKKQPFLDLNKRQINILKYLQTVPSIRREDYCHLMEVSTMTAFRDLNDLHRKKLLKVDGRGRGTKYKLATM